MSVKSSDSNKTPGVLLAAIQHSGGRRIDRLIASIAGQLKRQGLRVGGVVQSNVERAGECRCDMRLEELTTGRIVSISQRLGPQSRGCRLNDVALEQIVALVEASLEDGLDILILNKFGRQEAEGKGLRTAVAHAVAADIPVLVGLNRAYVAEWREFCEGEGQLLEAEPAAVTCWLDACLAVSGRALCRTACRNDRTPRP
jgi:nucleoside-triphosphatase THEP1